MALDPKDVSELQKALNDAAGKASVLWTTFVTFELYLVIAFGSVTHRDLFLETPIKLPVLNVDLPLVGFFLVAPTVLVILHFYVFLQLLALAAKSRDYDALLRQEAPIASDRQYLRQRLDSFLVLQFLAGPKEQRTGFGGISLVLIAWLTLVCAPVIVLLQGQMTFLPYHREWVVWLQRLVLFINVVVIWYFWDRIRSDDDPVIAFITSTVWRIVGAAGSVCVVAFSVCVATFPGELSDKYVPNVRIVPTTWWPRPYWASKDDWTSLHALLFAGAPDEVTGRPGSLLSNRLVLTDQSFVDHDNLDKVIVSHSWRGRDLRQAVLNRADLRKADFTGAILDGASFEEAKLDDANFSCAVHGKEWEPRPNRERRPDRKPSGCTSLRGAFLGQAQLHGANFYQARLQGADFSEARLQDAILEGAQLQNANIDAAQLQNANLRSAHLEGAQLEHLDLRSVHLEGANLLNSNLSFVDLRRANLTGAMLVGAILTSANLDGANLSKAQIESALLTGATMRHANLVGATLHGVERKQAQLQGAIFIGANLEGVDVGQGAQLQGASFNGAKLNGTMLGGAQLRDADFRGARLINVVLDGAQLRGADFRQAQLFGVVLDGAQLDDVDFRQAQLFGVIFGRASLQHANFAGAELRDSSCENSDEAPGPSSGFEEAPPSEVELSETGSEDYREVTCKVAEPILPVNAFPIKPWPDDPSANPVNTLPIKPWPDDPSPN
jgi:uncharacterized protein YjbI with pentapeptide repeats